MTIKVALRHVTRYRYDRLIQLGPQEIRLKPAPHTKTKIDSYSLTLTPNKHFLNWQQDPFSNYIARAVFPDKTSLLQIDVDLIANMQIFNPFDFFIDERASNYPFYYDDNLTASLMPYLEIMETGPLLLSLVANSKSKKEKTIDFLVELNSAINKQLHYIIRLEPGVQSCEETLTKRTGSCRDMAWLLCQLLRHLGLAARFTSGYLIQLKADIKALDGPSGVEQDFTDLHAWTEVYIPGAGWIGLDPTSGLLAGEGHIPLCSTPNPSSAAPISGTLDPCHAEIEHSMTIERIYEDKRITKPYRADEWQEINLLGLQVDQQLKNQDIRLTMGGEPTFVSADSRDSQEWQYTATSANKEAIAKQLLLRLKEKFSPGGLIHYGQGKWCPGELLPRWSFNCYWRADAEPIWQNPQLLAITSAANNIEPHTAKQFLCCLANALSIPSDYVLDAYEDAPYHLWQEQKSPLYAAADKADLHQTAERKRIQKLIASNLSLPVGYVLPLTYSDQDQQWLSNRWEFALGKLILTVGDSPIGLRLPLASLPAAVKNFQSYPRSLFATVANLPSVKTLHDRIHTQTKKSLATCDKIMTTLANGCIKTALSVEIRDNKLYVFLPPINLLENFLALIAAIEITAQKLNLPVCLEGYNPPKDLRIKKFSLTPDPGVLEVNIQPASSWRELVNTMTTVYTEAQHTRLSTQKFMLDGKCVGTEGGNHIVVGSAIPADSPFLRRPDLLQSMLTFWQNHPSLSYLFSSTYIGPTSQAPRIDEARQDSLYELEIAFKQLEHAKQISPWLIDRLFRNILVDITGNTHRSEFCIDKLYSPDHEQGRLGLLELRNFEMPPHPHMCLLQALLVRAVIALFWDKPYKQPLIRWGTMLHDKFMLPYYVWQDFKQVLRYLRHEGYPFNDSWFEPFFEFRFPHYGLWHTHALTIELRSALEPWPVLGEEIYHGTVSRAVDSAVERIQVKVTGSLYPYLMLSCNGKRLPLHKTDTNDTVVAGVRFKAWNPPSSLHPTISPQAPLVFDLVDCRYQRSLGGFTYHVAHPGGRNYETAPINENEAEGRRLARFQLGGHTSGKIMIPELQTHHDFPYTLDLRYALTKHQALAPQHYSDEAELSSLSSYDINDSNSP